jgi:hypothetical protein
MGSHRCAMWVTGGFARSVTRDRLMRSSDQWMILWCRDMCCLNLISVVPGVLKVHCACVKGATMTTNLHGLDAKARCRSRSGSQPPHPAITLGIHGPGLAVYSKADSGCSTTRHNHDSGCSLESRSLDLDLSRRCG